MKFELVKPKTKVGVLASMGALAIGLAASGPVAAQVTQSAETMSMEQAVLAAVQVHPSIRGARAQELQLLRRWTWRRQGTGRKYLGELKAR